MATWRRAQVGQTTRQCDEVNEGLVSRAATCGGADELGN